MASEKDTTIDRDTFEAALRVQQSSQSGPVAVPGPIMQSPPICPSEGCVKDAAEVVYFLYVVRPNEKGDILLACLNCGYEAVYRLATNVFEARPGRPDAATWTPPYRAARDVVQRMSQGEPAKFSVPKAAKPAVEKPLRAANSSKKQQPQEPKPEVVAAQAQAEISPAKAVPLGEIKAFSVKEAAAVAGVHTNKIVFAIKRGELKAQDIAGIKIVLSHDLSAWMAGGRG